MESKIESLFREKEKFRKRASRSLEKQAQLKKQNALLQRQIEENSPWKPAREIEGSRTPFDPGFIKASVDLITQTGISPSKVGQVLKQAHGGGFVKKGFVRETNQFPSKSTVLAWHLLSDKCSLLKEGDEFVADDGPIESHWDLGSRGGVHFLVHQVCQARQTGITKLMLPFVDIHGCKTGMNVAKHIKENLVLLKITRKQIHVNITDAGEHHLD